MRIEAKIAGQRRELFAPYELEWPVAKALTIGELIEAVVRHEVDAFRTRRHERLLDRVLSKSEIDDGARLGKVGPEGRTTAATVDADDAVATAIEAFTDGLYFVFVDGKQIDGVGTTVHVVPTSTLLFVRLTPLVGG